MLTRLFYGFPSIHPSPMHSCSGDSAFILKDDDRSMHNDGRNPVITKQSKGESVTSRYRLIDPFVEVKSAIEATTTTI